MMGRPLDLMDKKVPIWKLVFKLAWPAVVEQLLQTIVGYVDTAMVGNIGVAATAAVGVTTSTVWMINGFMNAAGIGYAVQVAHHLGAGGDAGDFGLSFDADCAGGVYHCPNPANLDAGGRGCKASGRRVFPDSGNDLSI